MNVRKILVTAATPLAGAACAVEHGRNWRLARAGTASALLALAMMATWPVRADEPPSLRQGLWQFERTLGGQKLQSQQCVDPSEDMKRQNELLEKNGCKFSPGSRSGNTYSFSADCSIKAPGDVTVNVHSASVMTVADDSAYKVEITTIGAGTSTQETLLARRVGDCAN